MMKKILAAGALVASTALMTPQASAQTFTSAPGSFTLANVGSLTVSKGITLTCSLSGSGQVVSASSARVTNITLGGGLCGSITFSGYPYAVSAASTTSITLNGVTVTAITGNCAGTLTGSYNQATGLITFANATIPATSGIGACRITGQVRVTPTVTYTVP
ncbi:hypothetical protein [Sphingomonas hylomeconis]|uniref:Protein activator of alkane oxidation PraB n=1 Tax=Sphingomonas hylomeconis TaxID=1395958 RepID=A0ABV7SUP4_9SPHN|nr:hypothetical protein [Sphingomonas hylomeconis]